MQTYEKSEEYIQFLADEFEVVDHHVCIHSFSLQCVTALIDGAMHLTSSLYICRATKDHEFDRPFFIPDPEEEVESFSITSQRYVF